MPAPKTYQGPSLPPLLRNRTDELPRRGPRARMHALLGQCLGEYPAAEGPSPPKKGDKEPQRAPPRTRSAGSKPVRGPIASGAPAENPEPPDA
jgi:hypothetical protein